ncbi:MAG: tRNA pseudouridine(55) synthase TruB [Planctomycetaceae bacterium]|nr:tRNA pseudouridine(55) synthase TruB [Planctomycetaceae bacterium]
MNGILVVNKSPGMTSRDVVNRVQRLTGIRKCGHAGTLDPLATGVLVVCMGQATRLVSYVQSMQKTYRAQFRFGITSDTDDIEGVVTPVANAVCPSEADLQAALLENMGEIDQVPPQYSAVKVKGQRAYKLAREGTKVELKARVVSIHRFDLLNYQSPDWEAIIECGSGTYIRSLGRDLGQKFGCGAVMTSLSREAIGQFSLGHAVSLEELEEGNWQDELLPPREATKGLLEFHCNSNQTENIKHGRAIRLSEISAKINITNEANQLAMIDPEGKLVAIAEIAHELKLAKPRIVFSD